MQNLSIRCRQVRGEREKHTAEVLFTYWTKKKKKFTSSPEVNPSLAQDEKGTNESISR